MLIRTTLIKSIEWDLNDLRGFGSKAGTVKIGSGLTFSEIGRSASDNNRIVAEGWTHSVGIAGWSTGGGHGPFAGWAGLGVDNLLEAEIVTSNGTLLTANANSNSDLYYALRGGGGSTWGVLTRLTIRAHPVPPDGFHQRTMTWAGDTCPGSGKKNLHQLIDALLAWTLTLDSKWSGLIWVLPTSDKVSCGATWLMWAAYVVPGTASASAEQWTKLKNSIDKKFLHDSVKNYKREDQWTAPLKIPIEVKPYMAPHGQGATKSLGGVPSILVSREMTVNGRFGSALKERIADCNAFLNTSACGIIQIYDDITGHIGSPQAEGVSITDDFRKGIFHVISDGGLNQEKMDTYYAIGNSSYFGESAIDLPGDSFKQRYWGGNYDKLVQIKQKYDPTNFLWCRNCVGSDL
jgi:hypothetical protein